MFFRKSNAVIFGKLVLCSAFLSLTCGYAFGSCTAPQNAIEAENCLPGNDSSQWMISGNGDSTIQGFATDMSVNIGQTISFKINTPASAYTIGIFRLGYYSGLGARKVASITPSAKLPQTQPACLTDASTNLYDCGNWAISASWTVPSAAVPGVYIAVPVRSDTGGMSQIAFVVRDDLSHSDVLFQTSDETWQAYNPYGGHSLYGGAGTFDLTNRAYKVSYNRPFNVLSLENESWLFYAESPMIRWLEANGYDVSYTSSVDAARNGALIKNHKVYLSVGHDEYVSAQKRASMEAARDAGVNLAFLSGNEVFWKTRWENSIDGSNTVYRTLVCYKETLDANSNPVAKAAVDPQDPPTWTGTWRDPTKSPPADGGRPENALTGQLFRVNGPGSDNTNLSIKVPAAEGKMRFWRNTQVASQSAGQTWTLPAGTLGYEWDVEQDNGSRPAGLFDLSTATYPLTTDYLLDYGGVYGAGSATHHMTTYRASSGALVFGAGTVQWSWGLDSNHIGTGPAADLNMQQATVNLFADMGVQPVTLQAGLLLATKSTDTTPPGSSIASPANGTSVQSGASLTISGTASDGGGGLVAGVEVSIDGGVTWHPATGTTSWSYTGSPCKAGSTTVLSRAVDDSGNIETPTGGITINVTPLAFGTIFCPGAVPGLPDQGPDNSAELGVKFTSDTSGTISGIRFYKSSANTGTHIGDLWTATGTLLASATFTNESASGWQQVNFSSPVSITANTVYVASYHTTVGHYAEDNHFFSNSAYDNAPLHAFKDGSAGANGVYGYGSGSTFPTQGWEGSNYWVDVAFVPNATATSITVAPANPTIQAGATQQFTATGTFSDGSTRDITTQVTWSSSNSGVASVSASGLATSIAGGISTISAAQGTVTGSTTLTVQAATLKVTTTSLQSGTRGSPYLATITAVGGTAPYTWALVNNSALPAGLTLTTGGQISGTPSVTGTFAFTVQVTDGGSPQQSATQALSIAVVPPPAFFTIWPSTIAPTTADAGADSAVELGVKFKADANGTISGIRFYKSTGNTGTHVGNLWNSSGNLLASATFTNETASGWQQVNFSTPVTVTANTVYIASYHSTIGHYSEDDGYFTSNGVDNPPLHALQDGVSGADGVYAYGTNSIFPTQAFQGANYWIDVVFEQTATLNSIAVTPASPTIAAGGTQQFTATGTYSDGSTQNITTQATWSSSNTAISTINAVGLASGVAGGTSGMVAKVGAVTGNATLTVQPAPLTISTTSLPSATQNVAYSATLNLSGGSPTYTWSLSPGTTLPNGLTLSSGGQITGTPTGSGTTNFSVQVTDSGTPAQTSTQALTMNVSPNACPCTITGTISGPGSGATVVATGTASATATANASGVYTLGPLPSGSYTVTPTLSGYSFNPANQPVAISGANVSGINFISSVAAPPISIDATAFKDQSSATTSVTTATFSTTSSNELLLAFIATDAKSSGITVTGVTGAGLTWSLVQRTNTQLGTAEVWRAFSAAVLTSVSVKASLSQSVTSSITVMSFSGVDTTGTNGSGAIGNVGSGNAGSGAPTAQVTTTRNNSLVIGVGNDWDSAIARTVASGQTLVHQYLSPSGDTYWVQRTTSAVLLSGTVVTINDTAPTTDRYNLSIVEVRTP
jgi:hypothetical protein